LRLLFCANLLRFCLGTRLIRETPTRIRRRIVNGAFATAKPKPLALARDQAQNYLARDNARCGRTAPAPRAKACHNPNSGV
jgi:hypothetical protein